MLKIDIISGFLGAGKTTFIERLLKTNLKNEKVVLVENEYGEVSVDTDILRDTKINITELSQGCICCSLVGDFEKALNELIKQFNPDRILIEPSGVGKLSDIIVAVGKAGLAKNINSLVCMVDCKKAKMYDKNFGEFFIDQIKNAQTVILSRTDIANESTAIDALNIVRKHNPNCIVVTTPIKDLSDDALLKAYEGFDEKLVDKDILLRQLNEEDDDEECDDPNCSCHHHHHHDHDEDDDDDECECHHHHDHDEDDDDDECECHHHHDHDEDDDDDECDDPNCSCHHHHNGHHHHHADEVFESIGIETVKKYDIEQLKNTLNDIANGNHGMVVRAKGIVQGLDSKWYLFQLTPGEVEFEETHAIPQAKLVVIGSHINSDEIKKLF